MSGLSFYIFNHCVRRYQDMENTNRYNYLGQYLGEEEPRYASDDFKKKIDDHTFIPDWREDDGVTVDRFGFDRTNIESNGKYTEEIELPINTMLCRYGGEMGFTTTLLNTPYEKLGLPYVKETQEYHEYEVIANGVTVKCIVTKGRVAPAFHSEGGAIQFLHKRTILEELNSGRLREVTIWREKRR